MKQAKISKTRSQRSSVMGFLLFLFAMLSALLPATAQFGTIKGSVRYYTENQILIRDSAVVTLYLDGLALASCPVSPAGSYEFNGLMADTYDIHVSCTKYWGGANSVDALLVLKHFVNQPACLFDLCLLAADVNASCGIPNAADALAIIRRFTGQIMNFMPPNVNPPGGSDWVSERPSVIVYAFSVSYQNIHILCTGDVNGSFTPF
ncbi:MAG TPA: hypothetical protein P5531_14550 [Bacteroidales bacterium]|nr:hypothetical protein [Bacteroidales bacterium]HSA44806.1 hypothetical protein [Bacteroidales bacterium]